MKKISLFIVDDHYMVIEGIRSLIQHDPDIEFAGHASTASSCLAFLQNNQPDVILMDISLPDQSGVDLCREVKNLYPFTRVIGLSTFNQHSFISRMMDNGASGYLLKNASKQEITTAVRKVMTGQKHLSYEALLTIKHTEDVQAGIPILTRREKEILEMIAEGMTNPEIAEKLFVSVSTVDTHRKNLLTKFKVKNTASLIKIAAQSRLI